VCVCVCVCVCSYMLVYMCTRMCMDNNLYIYGRYCIVTFYHFGICACMNNICEIQAGYARYACHVHAMISYKRHLSCNSLGYIATHMATHCQYTAIRCNTCRLTGCIWFCCCFCNCQARCKVFCPF